jgi:endonuclease VIII
MPEGDTIHYAANRIRPILEGAVPDEIATPHPRFGRDRWPERLAGQVVRSVDAHGKHLFLRFEGGLVIHSHLRMTGAWRIRETGRGVPSTAWLVLRRGEQEVVQLKGPVLAADHRRHREHVEVRGVLRCVDRPVAPGGHGE